MHALSLLLSAFFLLVPEPAPSPPVKPAAASPAQPLETIHLLDRPEAVRFELPPKASPPAHGPFFQPFWFSAITQKQSGFHRRVIVHDSREAVRDMREALLLPVPSKAFIDLPAGAGRVLTWGHLVLGAANTKVVAAKVTCSAGSTQTVLWEAATVPAPMTKVQDWPARQRVVLPDTCTKLALEAAAPDGKAGDGQEVVWENPQLERPFPAGAARPYNVLYIVIDAARSDAVGKHRDPAISSVTPFIDTIEATGSTFPNAYSNGNTTLLSMNALLLGAHPRAMGFLALWWAGKDRRPDFYATKPPYLTRLLHGAGYVTFGATHNHLYFPGYRFGVDPGFDVLQDCGRDADDHPILTRRAISFMEQNRDRRFLVQVNLIGPHQPYTPPKPCLEKGKAAAGKGKTILDPRYLGEICWADEHVGQLVAALDRLGLRSNTLVVITSDHGEVMDSLHDCPANHEGHKCGHLHGLTLYDEEINVPLIFSLPGVVKGQSISTLVQHADIAPTILDLVGLKADPRMTGRTLVPALVQGKALPDVTIYSERWLARAVRMGDYKLIFHTKKDDVCPVVAKERCGTPPWWELYDLSADPREHKDLSRKLPEKVKELETEMNRLRTLFYQNSGAKGLNP
jgi:arylsulfatase A-like enzyme